MANGLTTKQEAFVLAYIGEARFNATKAARIAGYAEKYARQQGSENLANPDIAARVTAELKARAMPAEAVLAELTDIATAPWGQFVKTVIDPKTGDELPVAMDVSNKVKSLEVLAKAHGLLTDKIDLTANVTAQVELVGVDPGDV